MNYNLIDELSINFKNKLAIRTVSCKVSEDKPILDFVPKLK